VAGPGELLGGRQSGGPGPHDRDGVSGEPLHLARPLETLVPSSVGDRDLDVLDRDRIGPDSQHARRLAGRRAQPSG